MCVTTKTLCDIHTNVPVNVHLNVHTNGSERSLECSNIRFYDHSFNIHVNGLVNVHLNVHKNINVCSNKYENPINTWLYF